MGSLDSWWHSQLGQGDGGNFTGHTMRARIFATGRGARPVGRLARFRMLSIALSKAVLWAPMERRTAMRFRQVDAAEEQFDQRGSARGARRSPPRPPPRPPGPHGPPWSSCRSCCRPHPRSRLPRREEDSEPRPGPPTAQRWQREQSSNEVSSSPIGPATALPGYRTPQPAAAELGDGNLPRLSTDFRMPTRIPMPLHHPALNPFQPNLGITALLQANPIPFIRTHTLFNAFWFDYFYTAFNHQPTSLPHAK